MERTYKTYIVKARRESNGKEFTDKFTAYSKADARCCFRECYRHDVYTILEVTEETEESFQEEKWRLLL